MVDDGRTCAGTGNGRAAHGDSEAGGGVCVGQAQSARRERAGRCTMYLVGKRNRTPSQHSSLPAREEDTLAASLSTVRLNPSQPCARLPKSHDESHDRCDI